MLEPLLFGRTFVLERAFCVGLDPSIQMYSAKFMIFFSLGVAHDAFPLGNEIAGYERVFNERTIADAQVVLIKVDFSNLLRRDSYFC